MSFKTIILSIAALSLFGCDTPTPPEAAQTAATSAPAETVTINPKALQAHIEFLAHDLLEGRDTGSRGYDIAAQYVASHFKQFGLTPAGDQHDGTASYLQAVTFRMRQLDTSSPTMTITGTSGQQVLSYPEQFMTSGSSVATDISMSAPMVFVGYGISAPNYNHDDYANLDVKDKVVVMLQGFPESLPSEQGAHLSSGRTRAAVAAEKGAVGMIYLPTPKSEKRYSYARMQKSTGRPSFSWVDGDGNVGNAYPQLKAGAIVSPETAEQLFENAASSYQTIIEQSEANQPIAGFDMELTLTFAAKTNHQETLSYNVAGIVEGTDPSLKNEYVIYSAHLDHIGTHGDEEDNINNGALDNASGTSIMIETARQFALNPPKRSVLFVAVTGEEKGLLGSDFYAQNPTVPAEGIIANINLDMPLILYPIGDVIAFGAEHSTMGAYVQRAAEKMGLQLSPDPMPEQNIFVRSDHYSFVKQGVPSVFLIPGFKSLDESINGGEIFQQFLSTHYHSPSDQFDLPIDYQAGVTFTKVNYMIGQEIANDSERPRWHEGNFFGETFAKK